MDDDEAPKLLDPSVAHLRTSIPTSLASVATSVGEG
jgi:hypothetical protein